MWSRLGETFLTLRKSTFSQLLKEKCITEVVRIDSLFVLRKAKFSILCDVIFLVRLMVKFEIDHSWE